MVTFQVNDMTCGHCASAISRALASVDRTARLDIRIQEKLVRIESQAPATKLAQTIQDAGYTAQEVQQEPAPPASPRTSSGCGCGRGPRKPAAVDIRQQATTIGGSCCS
jgi:copper chaperone